MFPMPTLRESRIKKAMSQRDLAKASGVALGTISDIELRKRSAHFITRRKLAEALGVPVEKIDF
jgi:transcriptional regulator with XRE-family HTH domain